MTIIEWIESNVKEGSNVDEAKKLIAGMDVLNVNSKEEAAELMKKNKHLKAALDAETTRRVDNALEHFKETKLPGLIEKEKEEIRKSLSPEETEEQKRIRMLEEKLQSQEQALKTETLKAELRKAANEKGYDVARAERLAVYGQDAKKMLESEIEFINSAVNNKLQAEIKSKFGSNVPESGKPEPADMRSTYQAKYDDAMKNRDVQKAMLYKEQLAKIDKE